MSGSFTSSCHAMPGYATLLSFRAYGLSLGSFPGNSNVCTSSCVVGATWWLEKKEWKQARIPGPPRSKPPRPVPASVARPPEPGKSLQGTENRAGGAIGRGHPSSVAFNALDRRSSTSVLLPWPLSPMTHTSDFQVGCQLQRSGRQFMPIHPQPARERGLATEQRI